MKTRKANEAHFFFLCGDLEGSTFEVAEFSGVDRVSAPYQFDITLISSKEDISPDSVINKPSTFFIHRDGEYFPYSGIVSEFEFVDATVDHYTYKVRLVPRLWLLSLNSQTRVFQKKTIPDIIEAVLSAGGVSDYDMQVQGTQPQHDLIVQYQESDLDFVCRLMEQSGIWFFFKEVPLLPEEMGSVGSEKLIITNKPAQFEYVSTTSDIMYVSESGMHERMGEDVKESVSTLKYRKQVIPKKVTLRNYNYRTPESAPAGEKQIQSGTIGTVYEYGGMYKSASEAQAAAAVVANRIVSEQVAIDGTSNCRGFRAGYRFTLSEHPRTDLNTNHVLTQVSHAGGHIAGSGVAQTMTYKNQFRCFPGALDQTFAPEKRTPIPKINGVITATIEANGSEYASIDEMGRYKVRFPFDLSDTANFSASKFVRLAQPYSGQNYGIHFPSHEGTEMILACIEGDPSKPLGLGTVPNANTVSPVVSNNKNESVIRTAGGNEMVLDDTDGKQKVRIKTHASNVAVFDDENKKMSLTSTDGNKLEIDDKNECGLWDIHSHQIKLAYKAGEEGIVIATAGGHVIKIDDKNKKIQIQTSGGHGVEMDDNGKKITLKDGQGKNTVTLDGNGGLKLESQGKIDISAQQDLTIKAANIKISANASIEAKATSDLKLKGMNVDVKGDVGVKVNGGVSFEVKGGAQGKVEAAMLDVSGSGITKIKGGLVMIN